MIKVFPLPVAIQNASLLRSSAAKTTGSSPGGEGAEVVRKSAPVSGPAVQEDLGIQRGEVLKVAQRYGLGLMAVYGFEVPPDVLVVALQVGERQLQLVALRREAVEDAAAALAVEALV
jgi:hypothetical protein